MPKPMMLMNITDNKVYMAAAERRAAGADVSTVMLR